MTGAARLLAPLELWGGVECTHNRVGDRYFDQLDRTGHNARIDDLDLFAGLGVRAMRYPILWERTAPHGLESADWSWADQRLYRLRGLGIEPIVGLVHHGSGPPNTDLLDPGFPEGLARYAKEVARRYPWVRRYTPVNEPLSTARFAGLYGHWYPHGRDALTWARVLLTECRAIALAMRAIREVNPDAHLVQTEDLGKVYSTSRLAYQAEFENERRWLSFDLLCGRVGRGHSMYQYLRRIGVEEVALEWFLEYPCPPDIMGMNYYITSERFLDDRLHLYPRHLHGGNGRHQYADVEAVRVLAEGPAGVGALLPEAWARYRLPMAITEAHLGASPDEQIRWLSEVWDAALRSRERGIHLRAVTIWSLLGAYDWDSLVTKNDGHYEPGVFDVRSGQALPTPLVRLATDLGYGRQPDDTNSGLPGWWRRPERLLYPPVSLESVRSLAAR